MLSDPTIDAVFILTPDHLHAEMLGQAIAAAKHVFIEKPVCLTLAELEPLIEANRGNPKVVFVGYMRRFSRPFLELKRRMPDPAAIRHVKVRDIIREAPFFQGQTRPVLRGDDIPPEVVAEGRRRTAALVASRHRGRRARRRPARLPAADRPRLAQLLGDARAPRPARWRHRRPPARRRDGDRALRLRPLHRRLRGGDRRRRRVRLRHRRHHLGPALPPDLRHPLYPPPADAPHNHHLRRRPRPAPRSSARSTRTPSASSSTPSTTPSPSAARTRRRSRTRAPTSASSPRSRNGSS